MGGGVAGLDGFGFAGQGVDPYLYNVYMMYIVGLDGFGFAGQGVIPLGLDFADPGHRGQAVKVEGQGSRTEGSCVGAPGSPLLISPLRSAPPPPTHARVSALRAPRKGLGCGR